MIKQLSHNFQYGSLQGVIETGYIATQATAAVTVTVGDTVVLVTVVVNPNIRDDVNFLPLSVHYMEQVSSVGLIPGGHTRREGKPTDRETLISRFIDRSIRPLFPDEYYQEIQVNASVISLDPEVQGDILALIGTSAALSFANIPFDGPIAGLRVGYQPGVGYKVLFSEYDENTQMDMVVAGTSESINMVETGAQQLSEDILLDGLRFAHQMIQPIIESINEMRSQLGAITPEWVVRTKITDKQVERVRAIGIEKIKEAYSLAAKQDRNKEEKKYLSGLLINICQCIQKMTLMMTRLKKSFIRLKKIMLPI